MGDNMIGVLINLVIYLLVIGLILWLLNYLIDNLPMPDPFRRVAKIVLMVVGVLILIILLLGLVGGSPGVPRLHIGLLNQPHGGLPVSYGVDILKQALRG
jgi:hypothetical protein